MLKLASTYTSPIPSRLPNFRDEIMASPTDETIFGAGRQPGRPDRQLGAAKDRQG